MLIYIIVLLRELQKFKTLFSNFYSIMSHTPQLQRKKKKLLVLFSVVDCMPKRKDEQNTFQLFHYI